MLIDSAMKGRAADILDICSKHPECLEHTDKFGRTPLYWAAAKGKVAAIKVRGEQIETRGGREGREGRVRRKTNFLNWTVATKRRENK